MKFPSQLLCFQVHSDVSKFILVSKLTIIPKYNFNFKTRRVPIHCMYDIRNGQPIWCKVENVIHNFGHHAVEIDENRIFIMDVHQTVLITEARFQIETRSLIG